jgi:hypothetical protein
MEEIKDKKDVKVQQVVLPVVNTIVRAIEPVTLNTDTIVPSKGQVLVCMVKPDGTEKPNSDFLIGEATYNKFYANNPSFRLKKKFEQ